MNISRILHVEDDPDIQSVAKISLEIMGGFTLCQCSSGHDAIQQAAEFRPDLLLLDAMMPEMSGMETLNALRKIAGLEFVPAIFLTAKVRKGEVQAFSELGTIGVIKKPFDPATLAEEVRSICEKNQ
jgi:two-component system, OmpR family, response regulator